MADKPHQARAHVPNLANNFAATVPETAATSPPAEPAKDSKGPRQMDRALRLANKVDGLLEQMDPWARDWALNYLWAKYRLAPTKDAPA